MADHDGGILNLVNVGEISVGSQQGDGIDGDNNGLVGGLKADAILEAIGGAGGIFFLGAGDLEAMESLSKPLGADGFD